MPSLQRKVVSVADTQKITQAMKMVSSTELNRVQDGIFYTPGHYADQLREVLGKLSEGMNRASHPHSFSITSGVTGMRPDF